MSTLPELLSQSKCDIEEISKYFNELLSEAPQRVNVNFSPPFSVFYGKRVNAQRQHNSCNIKAVENRTFRSGCAFYNSDLFVG